MYEIQHWQPYPCILYTFVQNFYTSRDTRSNPSSNFTTIIALCILHNKTNITHITANVMETKFKDEKKLRLDPSLGVPE